MNPFDMLKNAKALQEQFSRMQGELDEMRAVGSSGGGIVKVELNGKFELLSVTLDPVAVDPRDVPMLQDLIVAAHRDASEKVKEFLKGRFGQLAGGFPAP
ncbi:MAG TPA: YbaB/EbfC family nucleoid-associated protein [Treponemataceae bacterium]|nr:YbaB/EbfC family nucleoid-associated protein [Treponemataceae bacterium]